MQSSNLPVVIIDAPVELADELFVHGVLDTLQTRAHVVHSVDRLEQIDEHLRARAEVLITSWGTQLIDVEVLQSMPALRAIVHTGGTIRSFVHPDVIAAGIVVSTQAEENAKIVAEYTLAMVVASLKGIFATARRYRHEKGALNRWPLLQTLGVTGKTIGIIGASRVGQAVIALLRRYDVEVVLYDPYVDDATALELGVRKVDLCELMRASDVVSLHAPATAETAGMITREHLLSMKPTATFINTARGSLVDQSALLDVLAEGNVTAVLDVTDPMVLDAEDALWDLDTVLLTPHIAGAVGSDLRLLGAGAVAEALRVLDRAPLHYAVLASDLPRLA